MNPLWQLIDAIPVQQAVYAVMLIPAVSAVILALIHSYRVTAVGNVAASGNVFGCSYIIEATIFDR